MSRNKEINIPESELGMSGYSKFAWKLWEAGICNMSQAEKADQIMRKQGYCKASEIIAEIEKLMRKRESPITTMAFIETKEYKEFKRQYTEEI
jgi:hypothetical protein